MVHYPFILDHIRQEPTVIPGLEVTVVVPYPYHCSVLVTAVMNPLCVYLRHVHMLLLRHYLILLPGLSPCFAIHILATCYLFS